MQRIIVGFGVVGSLFEIELMEDQKTPSSMGNDRLLSWRNSEQSVNFVLGSIIRAKNVRWINAVETEKTRMIVDSPGKRPDIVVSHPGGLPVIIETEFAPARTVEVDAKTRLGSTLTKDGRRIEQTVALCIPEQLATEHENQLAESLKLSVFEYCMFYERKGDDSTQMRWPEAGWIKGGIDDFVGLIERTALSESIISHGMAKLELGISQATHLVRNDDTPNLDTHKKISQLLNQKDGEQTTRMAMAIIANAITFQSTLENTHDITPLDQIKDSFGGYCKSRLYDLWQHILNNINYWPIFKIASDLLMCLTAKVADQVFDRLAKVAFELRKIGATSQHDLSGRMF